MITDVKMDPTSLTAKKVLTPTLVTAVSKTGLRCFEYTPGLPFGVDSIGIQCAVLAGTVSVDAGILAPMAVIGAGALSIDASPAKFQTAAGVYRVGGLFIQVNAQTALVFSSTHTVLQNKFGAYLVQIDNAGTITTKDVGTGQAYTSLPAAVAALPAADSGKLAIGYITVAPTAGVFTANTTSLATIGAFTTYASEFVSCLTAPITPVAGALVKGTPAAAGSASRGSRTASLCVFYTTDGSGVLTNGILEVVLHPRATAGSTTA